MQLVAKFVCEPLQQDGWTVKHMDRFCGREGNWIFKGYYIVSPEDNLRMCRLRFNDSDKLAIRLLSKTWYLWNKRAACDTFFTLCCAERDILSHCHQTIL